MLYKPIPSLNYLYEINETGILIRSADGRIMRPFVNSRGYLQVLIRDKGLANHVRAHTQNDGRVQVHCKIHHLVAEVFIGARPEGKVLDHIDRNKLNNHFSNLRYVTISENWHNSSESTKIKMSAVSKENVQKMLAQNKMRRPDYFSVPVTLVDHTTGQAIPFPSINEAGRFVLENYRERVRTNNYKNIARILGKGGIRYDLEIRRNFQHEDINNK